MAKEDNTNNNLFGMTSRDEDEQFRGRDEGEELRRLEAEQLRRREEEEELRRREEERARIEAENARIAAENARIGSQKSEKPVDDEEAALKARLGQFVSKPASELYGERPKLPPPEGLEEREPSRESEISIFDADGKIKPGIDVDAITPPAPLSTDEYAQNTALNKTVKIDPAVNKPGFFEEGGLGYEYGGGRLVDNAFKLNQNIGDKIDGAIEKVGTASDDLLGSVLRNLTPKDELGYTPEAFGKTFTDTFAITKPDGTKFYPDKVEPDATSTQGQRVTPNVDQVLQGGVEVPSEEVPSEEVPSEEVPSEGARAAYQFLANRGKREDKALPGAIPPLQTFEGPSGTGYQKAPEGMVKAMGPDGKMVFTTQDQANRMNQSYLSELNANKRAQQDFLSSDAAKEMTARNIQNVQRDYAQEQLAQRQRAEAARAAAKSDSEKLGFDEARRRAKGQLVGRNPSAAEVNQLARAIQDAEPERLAALKADSDLSSARLRNAEARENFKPRVIEIEGEKVIELSPGNYQQVRRDTPNQTGLELTFEALEADLNSGRLSQEEYDIAVNSARSAYIGKKEPTKSERDVVDRVKELQGETMGATALEGDTGGDNEKLDKGTAQAILNEAGGDKEEARRIARERGFVL